MIIKNVPFVDDHLQKYASCQGPPSVMMAFRYFRPHTKMSFEELYENMGYKRKTWFFETYITRFFHSKKIPVMYYSNSQIAKIGNNANKFKEICGLDYSKKKNRDELDIKNYDSGIEYVKSKGLFKKRNLDVRFIKEQLANNRLVIATVNRNKLVGLPGYKGHFILIKGFNKTGFVCNDAYLGKDLNISYPRFKAAFYYIDQSGKDQDLKICDIVVIG